ncbi:MAG: radical SAM protein [Firmicutes bacterium]|nr:radical SAM protein [Bacillota bacterium]
MRILLISPSSNRFYIPTAPLGISYLAAYLAPTTQVIGLDLNVLKWIYGLDESGIRLSLDRYLYKSRFYQAKPDLIGITIYQETLPEALMVAELARQYRIRIVAGGIFPTLFPDQIPPVFDFLIRGAGEIPFQQLVTLLEQRRMPLGETADFQIPGLSVLGTSGRAATPRWIHFGAPAPLHMASRVIPRREIFEELNLGFNYYSARVLSSHGCPYQCSFCANSSFSREWRPRPAADVVAEVTALVNQPKISEISFADDQFFGFTPLDYERAFQILHAIAEISAVKNIRVNLQARPDHFLNALAAQPKLEEVIKTINRNFTDPGDLKISAKIHGRAIRGFSLDLGVESFLEDRLAGFTKGLTVDEIRTAIRKARELEVDLGVYMILFTPDLTWEQLWKEWAIYYQEVLASAPFSRAAFFNFFQELVPYQGTPLYECLKTQGRLVSQGNFTGFKFADPRVALFYLLYNHQLQAGLFELEKAGLLRKMDDLLRISAEFRTRASNPALLESVIAQVVCECKDSSFMEKLYREIVRILPGV